METVVDRKAVFDRAVIYRTYQAHSRIIGFIFYYFPKFLIQKLFKTLLFMPSRLSLVTLASILQYN